MSDVFGNYKPSYDVFASSNSCNGQHSTPAINPDSKDAESDPNLPFDLSDLLIPESDTDFTVSLTREGDGDDDPYTYVADISPQDTWEGSGESFESDNTHDNEDDALAETEEKLEREVEYCKEQVLEKKDELVSMISELREAEKALKTLREGHSIERDY